MWRSSESYGADGQVNWTTETMPSITNRGG